MKHTLLFTLLISALSTSAMAANYILIKPVGTLAPSDKGTVVPPPPVVVASPSLAINVSTESVSAETGDVVVKSYTITNTGNVPLSTLKLTGPGATPVDCGASLAVGQSCVVSYRPDTSQARQYMDTIVVSGVNGSKTVEAQVVIYVDVVAKTVGLSLDSENATLAGNLGSYQTRTFVITNNNNDQAYLTDTTFTGGSVSGGYVNGTTPCEGTVPPNSTCAISISKMLNVEGTVEEELNIAYTIKGKAGAISIPVFSTGIDNWTFKPGDALPASKVQTGYNAPLALYITSATDPSVATWDKVSGTLPPGISLSGNSLVGTATAVGTYNFVLSATYKGRTSNKAFSLVISPAASCKEQLALQPGAPSGNYTLDVDGPGGAVAQSYYCDMVSDGGGWTQIVRQTEAEPVSSWSGGVNGSSYTLYPQQIPADTQIGIGKDNQATFVDYVNGVYQATDMNGVVGMTSPKTGFTYQVYHKTGAFYRFNNPEEEFYYYPYNNSPFGDGDWRNALTFDRVGSRAFTWSFVPNHATPAARGFGMNGSNVAGSSESYAWTVWVR